MEVFRVTIIEGHIDPRFDRYDIALYQSIFQPESLRKTLRLHTLNYDPPSGNRAGHFLDGD